MTLLPQQNKTMSWLTYKIAAACATFLFGVAACSLWLASIHQQSNAPSAEELIAGRVTEITLGFNVSPRAG